MSLQKLLLPDLFAYEQKAWAQGFSQVAGVDEVGRGPLAGPVVAAACIIPPGVTFAGINDSKKLTPSQREALFTSIRETPGLVYGVGVVGPEVIDEINILQATMRAMREAILALPLKPDFVLVDGDRFPALEAPGEAVVKGDNLSHSIMAASIIAKCLRDRLMREELDPIYPAYGFKQNKGYGTRAHLEALRVHGMSPVHRRSFCSGKGALLKISRFQEVSCAGTYLNQKSV